VVRVRFAPSPTGNLHIGTLRTALFSWLYAKHHGGTFVLRIEDTDLQRSESSFEKNIFDGLSWFGIQNDEGPLEGGDYGPYRQSERISEGIYEAEIQKLLDSGQAYYCFCTEEELNEEREAAIAAGIPYKYSRKALSLSKEDVAARLKAKDPYTIRFKIPDQESLSYKDLVKGDLTFDVSLIGDFVLMKSDGSPSYNFAVVVDDALMDISHVVRGEDHISNTPKQILLYQALRKNVPQFAHLPMILGPDKTKLSKRHGATAITDYEAMGFLSEAFFNYLSLLGWSPKTDEEFFSKDELVQRFSFDGISKSNAIFDSTKLTWMNGMYIRKLSPEALLARVTPFLTDPVREKLAQYDLGSQAYAVNSVIDNLERLDQINEYLDVFVTDEAGFLEQRSSLTFSDSDHNVLGHLVELVKDKDHLSRHDADQILEDILSETGLGKGKVFKPIRLALTAKSSGPHVSDVMVVFGPSRISERVSSLFK